MEAYNESHNFQVNLKGVLDVLANHLYSSEQVFIRELLQNSVDAIEALKIKDPDHIGKIVIELYTSKDTCQIMVEDNGIGLNESEVKEFLSSIGSSAKKTYYTADRNTFIGQFGIGLLSCFMVSDEITVITRTHGHPAIKWIGYIDGTYKTEILNNELSTGTKVYLRARNNNSALFEKEKLSKLVYHYGSILPYPISFQTELDKSVIINDNHGSILLNSRSPRLDILDYGQTCFNIPFLDYIVLDVPGLASGYAYIYPYAISPNSLGSHKVYLKRMLLSDHCNNLLPDWCFFVRCVVNVNHLRPTASRESLYDDENLHEFRDTLGKIIYAYILKLAENDREKLNNLLRIHENAFKLYSLENDEFFLKMMPFFRFVTNQGEYSLSKIKGNILHIPDIDEFRKVAPIATSKNVTIINSGYLYDRQLLNKYKNLVENVSVVQVDIKAFLSIFDEPAEIYAQTIQDFLNKARKILKDFNCTPEVKEFFPENLPVLYYMSEAVEHDRTLKDSIENSDPLWGGLLSGFVQHVENAEYSVLCFNFKNPLVNKLILSQDDKYLSQILTVLYVNALLMGHHAVQGTELSAFNENLMGIVESLTRLKA